MNPPWFTEKHTAHSGITLEMSKVLHQSQSSFQEIVVFENAAFGKVLTLDGCVMLTELDEFIYHEMITHPALLLHPNPQRVAVIGGGDGGSVREILKHPVNEVYLIEIDQAVIDVSRQHLPTLSSALSSDKVRIHCEDGFHHLANHPEHYDVIIIDSIDPVGESEKLFSAPFYQYVKKALRKNGVAVFQTESPFKDGHVRQRSVEALKNSFKQVFSYWAHIPTYPFGVWCFTVASDTAASDTTTSNTIAPNAPLRPLPPALTQQLRYFTPAVFRSACVLPPYMNIPTPPSPSMMPVSPSTQDVD